MFDLYRYALNAASLDFIAVTDHNYGAWLDTGRAGKQEHLDNEYQWWRTQKSADMFYLRRDASSRFTATNDPSTSLGGIETSFTFAAAVFSYRVPKLFIVRKAGN